ncbi:MAG: MBL fold metallo-hydrolase [Coriobacteriia bacterium]|nr:MBL fold metallo-hydrolase [Coriobacteriia bacterium]
MRLTVLGSAASYAGPGQACTGHYLEAGGARVLLDCGNGVLSNLGKVTDPLALDAVFVTHAHPDHFADLYALNSLLRYAPEGPRPPLALYMPEGLWEALCGPVNTRIATDLALAFVPVLLVDGESVAVGDLTITPRRVDHIEPTYALVAEADGARLVYTADTAPGPAAFAVSLGADLLLAEATFPEAYAGFGPHMTASQAGALARDAGVRALVLAHVWPTNDRAAMVTYAAAVFDGPVVVANELDVFEISPVGGKDD